MWTTLGLAFLFWSSQQALPTTPCLEESLSLGLRPGPDNMAADLTLLPASSKCTLAISLRGGFTHL